MTRSAWSSGYVVLDVVQANGDLWHEAGGTAANVAGNLAYLGWESGLLGRIGRDHAGRVVSARLQEANVDVSHLWLDPDTTTPIVRHEVLSGSHRYRFGCRSCGRGNAIFRPLPASYRLDEAPPAAVFFFDRPSVANVSIAESFSRAGALVVYEPSTRATLDRHSRACNAACVVKYSEERALHLRGRLPSRSDGQLWIITRGSEGTTVLLDDINMEIRAPSVSPIDAGGAGDWMTAGLIHRLAGRFSGADKRSLVDAVEWSQALAAISTTVPGARSLAKAIPRHRLADRVRSTRRGVQSRLDFTPAELRGRQRCSGCGLTLASR